MATRAAPLTLTEQDITLLRAYAGRDDIPTIADTVGRSREKVGLRLAQLCNLNRNTARELLARAAGSTPARPGRRAAASHPAPPAAEPAVEAPEPASDRFAHPGTRGYDRTHFFGDSCPGGHFDHRHADDPPADDPPTEPASVSPAVAPIELPDAPNPGSNEVVARYGALWCDHCGHCGPADGHDRRPGCDPFAVDITITRREAPCPT